MLEKLDARHPLYGLLRDRLPDGMTVLRPEQCARLAHLGIGLMDWLAFLALFVGHDFDYIIRRSQTDTWSLVHRPLPSRLLIDHLAGDVWIGTGSRWNRALRRHYTWYIAVDLDFGGDVADLLRRYKAVCDALGTPSVVFSTPSRGLHLYWCSSSRSSCIACAARTATAQLCGF